MNRNNLPKCSIWKYEKRLSAFGRKVLNFLVHESRESCYKESFTSPNTNKELPLPNNKSNIVNASKLNSNDERSQTYNRVDLTGINTVLFEIKNSQSVPKSNDLVKSIHGRVSPEISCYNTAFNIDNNLHNISTTHPVLLNTLDDIDNNLVEPGLNKSKDQVSWDDMFDSELLANKDCPENDTSDKVDENCNIFEMQYPQNSKKVENNNEFTSNNSKQRIKTHKNNTNDITPTKVKRVNRDCNKIKKANLRKQKYSKAVKNWLNQVEPTDTECDAQIQITAPGNTADAPEHTINCMAITFENIKSNKSKKAVQAQLANENGVMKYRKPKSADKREPSTVTTNENRINSKIIDPIKSLIPVKEITYDIISIENESHIDSFDLVQSSGQPVVVTVVYSNGFCQLNSHYSDDLGAPQAFMILIKDTFYYVPSALDKFKEMLQELLKKNSFICYEGKNILSWLVNRFGIIDEGCLNFLDAKIGVSLLEPDNPPDNFSELQKILTFVPEYTIATECVRQKVAWYMTLLQHCWNRIQQLLVERGLWNIYVNIEMRILPIISGMEQRGVRVDLERLKCMEKLLLEKMEAVEQACYEAAGKIFQINSTVQVRTVLYDELKLDSNCSVKITETISTGAKSTSEAALRSLVHKHPLPKLIVEYRHLHKAHATFLAGIAQCVRGGVVSPLWEQSAAATGRIACHNPNLQAVPKTFSLTVFAGEGDTGDEQTLNLRSLYVSRSGYCLLAADFRQVECRVFALAAADSGLLQALRGEDLFRELAASWLNKAVAEVSGAERERTKRVVYASMYGAGGGRLADVLGLSYEHALAVHATFNRTFPSLKKFERAVVSRCERDGQLRTPCGRTRHFKDITSPHPATKAQAERKAINFIIQGSAADLCKMAMVKTEEGLRNSEPRVDARLLLQIHDELVWEVRDQHLHTAASIIKTAMEGCGYECGMPTELPVALSCGRNWGEMKQFTPAI